MCDEGLGRVDMYPHLQKLLQVYVCQVGKLTREKNRARGILLVQFNSRYTLLKVSLQYVMLVCFRMFKINKAMCPSEQLWLILYIYKNPVILLLSEF